MPHLSVTFMFTFSSALPLTKSDALMSASALAVNLPSVPIVVDVTNFSANYVSSNANVTDLISSEACLV